MGSWFHCSCPACCLRNTDNPGHARKERKMKFIFFGPWLPVFCSSDTISEKTTDFCWLEQRTLCVSSWSVSAQPTITHNAVRGGHGGTNVSVNVPIVTVCIWVTEEEERKPKMPPWNCSSPFLDRNWRRPCQTCVSPSLVSFWALHRLSFLSLKLLFYTPREQSCPAARLVLCCLGFPGSMKLGCSLRLLSLIIFNVRPKVIFNEAEKYINKIACSN